jgi:hypothetical protein
LGFSALITTDNYIKSKIKDIYLKSCIQLSDY